MVEAINATALESWVGSGCFALAARAVVDDTNDKLKSSSWGRASLGGFKVVCEVFGGTAEAV